MNKLMTSLISTAAISMTLLGSGYIAEAATTPVDNTTPGTGTVNYDGNRLHSSNSMMNGTTGTSRNNYTPHNYNPAEGVRARDMDRIAPLSTTPPGTYRATSTTGNGDGSRSNWGWLGLLGLLGLIGMRNRTGERS